MRTGKGEERVGGVSCSKGLQAGIKPLATAEDSDSGDAVHPPPTEPPERPGFGWVFFKRL